MARIPDAFIDELLARSDIVEVIGSRLPLKRQGKEYAARCPFHEERSASFTVSPTKQFYHCFGCGAHGSAISFLMNYDRLEFLDAVDELSKRVGMEVPRETRQRHALQDSSGDLYTILDAAARFFQQHLQDNATALAYLDRRGVDAEQRTRFQIGYAPDGYSALKDTLGTNQQQIALLERAGLLSKNDRGHYDKFRDRVIFPIFDRRGRVIAFGGRVLDKDDGPKYLNSPETALFHKGRELYGLWQVRQANQKIERLVVVEGYMDVVSLFQFGVTQAVATLGTATTPEHAELLFRNTHNVYFCFDGDRAGRAAAWRALESVLPKMREEKQAFFLFLPEGEDPDSIVRNYGANAFNARLDKAISISEFYFNQRLQGTQLASRSGQAAFFDKCKSDILAMPDSGFRDIMAARIKELTGQDVFKASARIGYSSAHNNTTPVRKRSLVRGAMSILLQQPSLALTLDNHHTIAGLRQPGVELLLELVDLAQKHPGISTGALLEHFTEREEQPALHELAAQALPGNADNWMQELHDVMGQLEKQLLQQRLEELQTKQRAQGLDDTDKYELRELLKARGLQR